jgi:hypothetical protein
MKPVRTGFSGFHENRRFSTGFSIHACDSKSNEWKMTSTH